MTKVKPTVTLLSILGLLELSFWFSQKPLKYLVYYNVRQGQTS